MSDNELTITALVVVGCVVLVAIFVGLVYTNYQVAMSYGWMAAGGFSLCEAGAIGLPLQRTLRGALFMAGVVGLGLSVILIVSNT